MRGTLSPYSDIAGSTVCEMREASSSLDVDEVCPTPVAAHPNQMLLHQQLLGESTVKSAAWTDYGVSILPIRSHLIGRGAAGIG
eukprot:5692715-Amphidinium_carterae.1